MEIAISEDGFINMLRSQNGGSVIDELDRELAKGVQGIFDHGGNSTITLKIKLNRVPNMDTAVNIVHDVAASHPKEARPNKAMFVTRGSGLSDHYQEQASMDLGMPITPSKPAMLNPVPNIKGDKQ